MGLFSKLRSKDKEGGAVASPRSKRKANPHTNGVVVPAPPPKPRWEGDAWTRKEVEPDEIQELLRGCTNELKSRALDMPFLLLPFRPASDPSAARTFIRNFFSMERGTELKGERLEQELMLTEPMVCTIPEQSNPAPTTRREARLVLGAKSRHIRPFEPSHCLDFGREHGMLTGPFAKSKTCFRSRRLLLALRSVSYPLVLPTLCDSKKEC